MLAAQMFGKFVPAFLVLVSLVQPARVGAQSVSGIDPVAALTVTGAVLEAAEPALGPAKPPTAQEVLLDVCQEKGYGEDCAKTLLGMMWKESQNVSSAVGDRGLALGYFQIHYRMHKVTKECAQDLRCSAAWTLTYMERNGYPKYPTYAIQCHNGCNIRNGYAASVLRNARRLWGEPMTIALAQE
ncbi:MAG TPA: hypothetical protein VL426_06135 [Candidatus Binatia bacterium]|jgi:hypothetical protein|nr:hypothetical protein [Candidatus Binatia bacterium]